MGNLWQELIHVSHMIEVHEENTSSASTTGERRRAGSGDDEGEYGDNTHEREHEWESEWERESARRAVG